MQWLIYGFVVWCGLVMGSFMTMLVYRLQNKKPLWGKTANRSYCPHCQTVLRWYDLVPIGSFVWLKGRCRYCQKPIGILYLGIELLCVAVAIGLYAVFS